MCGCGANSAVQPHSMGGVVGGRRGTHRNTHRGTYTQMLHLPFSDLPLKKCPRIEGGLGSRLVVFFGL